MAGGAGLYINNDLQCIHRPDIKFSMPLVESCWSEIAAGRNTGCLKKNATEIKQAVVHHKRG